MSRTSHQIVCGDARCMSKVGDQSVQLVVTSPPYWQLKDYGCDEQLGFNDTYEDYINNLNQAWKECHRVLHDGCRLCINIGDQFARSVYYGRYKVIPIRTEIIRFCETIGFDFMGSIIWQKLQPVTPPAGPRSWDHTLTRATASSRLITSLSFCSRNREKRRSYLQNKKEGLR